MPALELPEKYAINLKAFDLIFLNHLWIWKLMRTSYGEDLGYGIKYYVEKAKLELLSKKRTLYLIEIDNSTFLPCLINYLAIVEINIGSKILETTYGLYEIKQKIKLVTFFEKYLDSTFKDYENIIADFSNKLEYYKEFIKKQHALLNPSKERKQVTIFNLTPFQIEQIVEELTLKNIINKKDGVLLRKFLENEPNIKLKFLAEKIQVTDFLKRVLFAKKNKYSKKAIAKALDKRLLYFTAKTKRFHPIPLKSIINDFSNTLAIPKSEGKRLLLTMFPD